VSFKIRFEENVRVGISEMMRDGIPKGRASMLKTTRGIMLIRGWERRLREAERS